MIRLRLYQFSAVLFGLFALYSAGRAIPVALMYPRAVGPDMLRFGVIAITVASGLALLLPHRSLPALRRFGERYSSFAPRFFCAAGLFTALLAAHLSGAVTGWTAWTVGILFFAVFVLPGFAFFGLAKRGLISIGSRVSGRLMGEYLRGRPLAERLFYITPLIFMFIGVFSFIFSKKSLPDPLWSQIVTSFAILVGLWIAAGWTYLSIRTTPAEARRGTLPGTILMALGLCLIAVISYRALLLDALPNTVARFWGRDSVQIVTVVRSDPNERRKGCHGLLTIRVKAGSRDICNLRSEFLSSVAPSDEIAIDGKATIFGQTIVRLRLLPEA